ncbi:MAG: transporter substrate-binding domain-containing protein [Oscillospiraceae bacterium]
MKKIIALLCALVLMLSLCAACGSQSAAETAAPAEPAEAAETTETAETEEAAEADAGITTIDEGKLTISTSPDFPPFEYTDDNGDVVGIEPELIGLIADKLGLELVIDAMDFDSALLAAQQGKSDAVVSGVTVTEDRKLVYDFSDTYISITQAIVCKEGAGITMDNLGEQSIGVQRGTTGHIYVEDDFGTDAVVAYDTFTTAFQALMNDQIDCIVLDDAVAQAYLATYAGLEMVETTYEPEDFAFGISKGNTALVEGINAALEELIADGTVQSLVEKYMVD